MMRLRRTPRMRSTRTVLLGCLLLAQAGCYTGVRGSQVTKPDADEEGIRYFLPAPLLVVDEFAPGKFDARVELTVDRSKTFTMQPTQVLAASTATVEFNADGTLKSFQLDQDSTEVPAAVVAGLKDLESKKLELQKAALDEAAKQAAGGGAAVAAANAGTRRVCVYRVNGTQPAAPMGCSEVAVASSGDGVSPAPATGATIKLSVDGSRLVISKAGKQLGTADRAKLTFIGNNGQKLSDVAALPLRQAAAKNGATLELDVATLRQHGISKVTFESAEADVPEA